jgi:hypothetical protein
MSGTLQDFLGSFMGGGAPDPNAAAQYHDRFVSTDAKDGEFDNQAYGQGAAEYLQQLPDNEFEGMAKNALSNMSGEDRAGVLGPLLSALGGSGMGGGTAPFGGGGGGMGQLLGGIAGAGGLGAIAQMLGLGTNDPRAMSDDDAAKVMNYARKQNPQALQQVVQEKPWFVKALGNPVVMGALAMAAQQLLSRRR